MTTKMGNVRTNHTSYSPSWWLLIHKSFQFPKCFTSISIFADIMYLVQGYNLAVANDDQNRQCENKSYLILAQLSSANSPKLSISKLFQFVFVLLLILILIAPFPQKLLCLKAIHIQYSIWLGQTVLNFLRVLAFTSIVKVISFIIDKNVNSTSWHTDRKWQGY